MMLADAINWPLFAALGLAVFGPLTLFVVLVECSVLRWFLGIPLRTSFRTVLLANVASTVAGCLIYAFQGILVHAWGLRTLYDFAHLYIWAALGLIVLYYAKSVVVEGLVVARRRFSEVSNLRRRQLWIGVMVANAASYLFVGPLFYFATRPTFEGTRIVLDPAPVAACQDTVFYLDRERMLCAIRADGSGQRQITTRPVENVWLDARCQASL